MIYARVSTEEQAKYGVSLAAQLERAKAYCLMSGFQVVHTISEDGVSGAKRLDSRPGRRLTKLAGRGADHIVALSAQLYASLRCLS